MKAAGAVGVVVIFAAILGPTVFVAPTATTGRTGSSFGAPATAPAASAEPWADLDVEPFVPVAELVADDQDRIGIGTNTSFTLRSLTSTPAAELARGLQVDPPVELTIKPGATADVASVAPRSPLVAGERYRVRLASADGALAGTWAFVTREPLHVVATLPGNQSVQVPTNTGIEITFDQDGATAVADHFTIKPAVAGRFETHERTWAFIPSKPLAAATIYTVTVHKGIGLSGASATLAADLMFQFETAVSSGGAPRIEFDRSLLEIRPDVEPAVAVRDEAEDEDHPAPTTVGIRIHRLPDYKAVLAAAVALAGPDSWAIAAPSATVSTAGLTKVAEVDAQIVPSDGGHIMTIPVRLAQGAYVVTIRQPGAPSQLLIQVTNLSAYAMSTSKTSVVWVNDLTGDASVAGATISIADGRALGSTDTDGVLRVATPAPLAPAKSTGAAQFITITAPGLGRLLVPLGLSSWTSPEGWWLLFATDRTTYRQTDTVHVYGAIRARDDRSVPVGLELRLRPLNGSEDVPVVRVPVSATARGVFTADVRLDDLPIAQYSIDLFVGNELVTTSWLYVGSIDKPAYRIDAQTDRRVYLLGDQVRVSTTTSFYDGTPVPGMELRFIVGEQVVTATTDALGRANVVFKAAGSADTEGVNEVEIDIAPVHPEEGQIGATLSVSVAPSRAWIKGQGSVTGGRIVVTGTLSWFDLVAFEAARAANGYLEDPSGDPIAAGALKAEVIHLVPERTQTGTTYDFIEKKVVPTYEYSETEVSLGTQNLTTDADGRFKLSLAAPASGDAYRVHLSSVDPERREVSLTVDASAQRPDTIPFAYLETSAGGCGYLPSVLGRLGAPVALTMRAGDGSVAQGGRFLFLVGGLDSLQAIVKTSATFERTLRDADLPGFTARGVWLSNDGYQVGEVAVEVDHRDKTLTIHLLPDRRTYQPGDRITIGVTTVDPAGHPVKADVVIQGVDEKLFTLGQASDIDPLEQLLAQQGSGFGGSYQSHAVPMPDYGGCGGGGDGGREDFRDAVTFQRITTDANGHGSVAFNLSDDITSWHMSAVAVSAALDAGHASVLVPVGLPFFVDAVVAPEFLVGDEPILRLRGYGAGLAAGDHVQFVVSAPSLGLLPTTVEGSAFDALRLPLPAMVAGDHVIRIEASATHGGTQLRDVLIRTAHVVDTRLGTVAASYDMLGSEFTPQGGDGLTTYVVTDAGRGRLIAPLQELASSTSARFEGSAAAELARRLLIEEFDVPASSLQTTGFDPTRYLTDGGVAPLPYGSADLFLAARAALVAGQIVDVDVLRGAFGAQFDDEAPSTRERQIAALAGLAGTGDNVLERLAAYDPATVTVREQLWLALGFAASGDEATARTIERSVLEADGQRLGPWVRLDVGTSLNASLEASGLLLLLAARLGDPIANDVSRYLADQPSTEQVFTLEQLGYVQGMLERLPKAAGKFAWTVGAERHEVTLDPGGAFSLVLTPGQRTSLHLEALDGQLAVATTWIALGGGLPSDPTISITRTVTPANDAPDNRLVKVTIAVTFGALAPVGCYRLTDLLPSGLAPVVAGAGWPDEFQEGGGPTVIGPYEVEGQRVSWCVSPADPGHTYGYSARVVTPGTYRWEPAVIQSETAPTVGSSTPATSFTIR